MRCHKQRQGPGTGSSGIRRDRLHTPSRSPDGPCSINPPERVILKEIRTYLNTLGCYIVRQQQGLGQRRGVPDLLVCHTGRFLALEVKRSNGKLSPYQAAELEKARQAGAVAEVVHSVHQLEAILQRHGLKTRPGDDDGSE